MADTFSWDMSEITTRFQELIGDQSVAAATCRKHINDYYQHQFPEDADVDDLKSFFSQATSAHDDGDYDLAQTDLKLLKPVTCDDTEIRFIIDHELFFRLYPDQEQYKTAPGLVIGTSDKAKVKHDDFTYEINGYGYEKSSSEITLSGSTIPQNKYGAFSFKIDTDGTITVAEASDNATGYDTPAKAALGLGYSDSSSAFMGYLIVMSTDSGGFVPGTTDLNDSAVTDYYTDGRFENRQKPEAITVFNNQVYARPKADDIYLIKAPSLIRPAAMEDDGSPEDIKWGPAIALGAAIYYLTEVTRDRERAEQLEPAFDTRMNSIRDKSLSQLTEQEVERSFL